MLADAGFIVAHGGDEEHAIRALEGMIEGMAEIEIAVADVHPFLLEAIGLFGIGNAGDDVFRRHMAMPEKVFDDLGTQMARSACYQNLHA